MNKHYFLSIRKSWMLMALQTPEDTLPYVMF